VTRRTVWVLGDQLNRRIGALAAAEPGEVRVLLVESEAKLASKRYHRQRLHLVIASMRRFAAELEAAGFEVDLRRAPSLVAGLAAHRREHRPTEVVATEPLSIASRQLLLDHDVALVRSDQFLCHYEDFATWAGEQRGRLTMEAFYRWRRRETGYLMDGAQPTGGRWNLDADNREPPPKLRTDEEAAQRWPPRPASALDDLDREVLASLPATAFGDDPDGTWATTRRGALARLRHFVDEVLPAFGPHEDAITERSWHLAHSLLSPYLNLGLLLPGEVLDAAEEAYRAGRVPLASAEGFVRQILGWREYVWGLYWLWMPGFGEANELGARRRLPPAFTGEAATDMRCVAHALAGVEARGYAHHIQRLMVLANLCLLAGVRPDDLVEWMWASFVDGAEWVMVPNVVGMALHADGGRMATKPYAGGGAYINRMSDHCQRCPYDPKRRTGDDACPFTTLYWDFLDRHRERFGANHRMAQPIKGLDRLADLDEVRDRAQVVLRRLSEGRL
jgi:deoxyribodipyrimidine photolyase-related protein